MAPATSSPRDHVADANPVLARKKQRFSDEDPNSSTDGPIIIEALEPEDIGGTSENAIEIEDDPNDTMPSYAEHFRVLPDRTVTPFDHLHRLHDDILQNNYIDVGMFRRFAHSINQHILDTKYDSKNWRQHYIEDDAEFFCKLAAVSIDLLRAGELFEPHVDNQSPPLREALEHILSGLTTLSRRIIPLLPDAMKTTLARRDSAQVVTRQQSLGSLIYIIVAQTVLMPDVKSALHFYGHKRQNKLEMIMERSRCDFFDEHTIFALARLIQVLSRSAREIKDAWPFMGAIMGLFKLLLSFDLAGNCYPGHDIEELLQALQATIVPAICEKHPRALPDGFHALVVELGDLALYTHAIAQGRASVSIVYKRFVHSETDALITHVADTESVDTALDRISNADNEVLARLLRTSWILQTTTAFLRSDIMDVRNMGIVSLKQQLVNLFNNERDTPLGFEHPVIQHAVRFLRENEITKYIFGPESRAGLVHHSADIICFLAATQTYTNAETDIIWRACSTSVETDFVKASLSVLQALKRYLSFEHLIYIAKKYATPQVGSLDINAFDYLETLLKELEEKTTSQTEALELALTAIDVLEAANALSPGPVATRLRHLCLTEIRNSKNPRFDNALAIYNRCVPEILAMSEHATTSVEVLISLLDVRVPVAEAEHVLSMLPVTAAIDELSKFVDRRRAEPASHLDNNAVIIRLGCITRLMFLADDAAAAITGSERDQGRLFDYVFGQFALCDAARDNAWARLYDLAAVKRMPNAAAALWQAYTQSHVPSLHADLVTPRLIGFVKVSLEDNLDRSDSKIDLTLLLNSPLWKALVRFAITSPNDLITSTAQGVVIDLLFRTPQAKSIPEGNVALAQTRFVRTLIEGLKGFIGDREAIEARTFTQALSLLAACLAESRKYPMMSVKQRSPTDLTSSKPDDGSNATQSTSQIHSPSTQPQVLSIRPTLHAEHPASSGLLPSASVVIGDREPTSQEHFVGELDTLSAGPQSPKPSSTQERRDGAVDTPMDDTVDGLGAVEQELVDHIQLLESFLDGPEQISHGIYLFLCNLRVSSRSQSRNAHSAATSPELFPHDKIWRSMYSLKSLQWHLLDHPVLEVAEHDFEARAIKLLVFLSLDESRGTNLIFDTELMSTLLMFLETPAASEIALHEQQKEAATDRVCSETDRLIPPIELFQPSRLIDQLLHRLTSSPALYPDLVLPGLRTHNVLLTYKALIAVAKLSSQLWDRMRQQSCIVEVHRRLVLDENPKLAMLVAQYIRELCQTPSSMHDLPNFYWSVMAQSVAPAMQSGPLADVYFGLASDVLISDVTTRSDETKIRAIVASLTAQLWAYRHTESTHFPVVDKAIAGLLQLISVAVNILRGSGRPLNLGGLASRLLQQLLFPPWDEDGRSPLITTTTRDRVYDLIQLSFEPNEDYDSTADVARQAVSRCTKNLDSSYSGASDWFRPPWNASGLSNLGMTCYMNSLLQQLFANLQFRDFLLKQTVREQDRDNVLSCVQLLFARMQDHTTLFSDTTPLAQALNIQIGNQEDVHTFYTTLLSRLEDDLPGRPIKTALTKFFTGKSVTQVKGSCGHVSSRMEAFTELSVTVKNKRGLAESLAEFVQGEPLEGANKYKCMTCDADGGGRLVDAMRRTCLEEVPDNLTFCLKRFTYESMIEGENKVNDRFEFPSAIDVSVYKRAYLEQPHTPCEPDEFELVGVIVHQGSLQFGHYWSYVRSPGASSQESNTWMCLEDTRYTPCAGGVQEVQEQCFGGLKTPNGLDRSDNAYVLFYQRKSYIQEARLLDAVSGPERSMYGTKPKIEVPTAIASEIQADNKWRQHVESLFNDRFSSLVVFILGHSPAVIQSRSLDEEEGSSPGPAEGASSMESGEVESMLGELIANYVMLVFLADPDAEARLDPFMAAVLKLVDTSAGTPAKILQHFCCSDAYGFAKLVLNESTKVRSQLFDGIWQCLSILREYLPRVYADLAPIVIRNHAAIVGERLDNALGKWGEYLAFASKFANLGFHETGQILDYGYLEWTLQRLQLRWNGSGRKGQVPLSTWIRRNDPDMTPLFSFVLDLLSNHVDLSEEDDDALDDYTGRRRNTTDGWCLRQEELEGLMRSGNSNRHELSFIMMAGVRQCPVSKTWEQHVPGQLFGLLVGVKAGYKLVRVFQSALISQHEFETDHLTPLLYITLHQIKNLGDQDAKILMLPISKTLLAWEHSHAHILWFFGEAYKLSPTAIIDTMPIWMPQLVIGAENTVRQDALLMFDRTVLAPPPLSANPPQDACRIRTTRAIAARCRDIVASAYRAEKSRTPYEPIIALLIAAQSYFEILQEAIVQQQSEGPKPARNVITEYDEACRVQIVVLELLEEIQDWEVEVALPTRSLSTGRPVTDADAASEDFESSDGDVDELT